MFRYYFILLIFFISNIFSQEISPIQSFTASDYDADIQNWMITQAEDNSIVVANSSVFFITIGIGIFIHLQKIQLLDR